MQRLPGIEVSVKWYGGRKRLKSNNRLEASTIVSRCKAELLATFPLIHDSHSCVPKGRRKAKTEMKKAIPALTIYSFEIVSLVVFVSAVLAGLVWPPGAALRSGDVSPSGPTNVMVELFTSEGCSSCPPADALLARYEAQQPVAGAQIIAVEEHVDYWDELGWVDPVSGRGGRRRLGEYAASLGNGNPYTPQMVIDGHTEFVGSREQQVRQGIAKATSKPKARVTLAFQAAHQAGSETLQVVIGKLGARSADDEAEVWLAMTGFGLHPDVTRGEKAGRQRGPASSARALREIRSAPPNAS